MATAEWILVVFVWIFGCSDPEAGEISFVLLVLVKQECIWDIWAGVTVHCCSPAFSPGDSFVLFVNKFSSSNC